MEINGGKPSSLLLDHLLIPAGVTLRIHIESSGGTIENHLPGSLDNLGNLSNFTYVYINEPFPLMRMRTERTAPDYGLPKQPHVRGG